MVTKPIVETCAWRLHVPDSLEEVVDGDSRKLVSSQELEVNGKYRPIVRLTATRTTGGKTRKSRATGWLIRSDIVVTAAHVVSKLESEAHVLATEIQAEVGYNGANSIQGIQHRYGTIAVIPCAWHCSAVANHDFAFVYMKSPFDQVVPFSYEPTPHTGLYDIGVVGYPSDKPDGMYEEFRQVDCSLSERGTALHYCIATYSGNSGSPVLHKKGDGVVVIATHSRGSMTRKRNAASPIETNSVCSYGDIIRHHFGGKWPQPYQTFLGGVEIHHVPIPCP